MKPILSTLENVEFSLYENIDTHKCFDYTSARYTIPITGWYVINGNKLYLEAGHAIIVPTTVYSASARIRETNPETN